MVGEFSQGLVAQKIRDTARPWMELEENIPPGPGPLRGMSPPGTLLHPGQTQGHGAGGHRLLYPGGL